MIDVTPGQGPCAVEVVLVRLRPVDADGRVVGPGSGRVAVAVVMRGSLLWVAGVARPAGRRLAVLGLVVAVPVAGVGPAGRVGGDDAEDRAGLACPRARYACPRSLRSLPDLSRVKGRKWREWSHTRARARGTSEQSKSTRSFRAFPLPPRPRDPNAGDDVAAPGPGHGSARDELLDELLDRLARRARSGRRSPSGRSGPRPR